MTTRAARGLTIRLVSALIAAALVVVGVVSLYQAQPAFATLPNTRQIEHGRRLVTVGGCNDCHTPVKFDPKVGLPMPQAERALSGHPEGAPAAASQLAGTDLAAIGPTSTSFRVPFGTVYAANLTPDPETGLGAWNENLFIQTIRSGRHLGAGRPILPPMPWPALRQLSDADLRAMFAYLQSLPPIHNAVPVPQVATETLERVGHSYAELVKATPRGPADEGSPHRIWYPQ